MKRTGRLLTGILAALACTTAVPAAAQASATTGYKAVAGAKSSGVAGKHIGYGPGWIALTFDTNGGPHGPVIGYLFHDGVAGAVGNDHFQVSIISNRNAAGVRTPFAGGNALGNFGGCAWSYLDNAGKELAAVAGSARGCRPPNHSAGIFCTNHRKDRLCSDGSSKSRKDKEGEPGVWRNTSYHRARINAGGCNVYGNIGAAAIYSGTAGRARNFITHVNSGTAQVRFVTKRGNWVMANLESTARPQLPYHLQWGFFPQSCLTST